VLCVLALLLLAAPRAVAGGQRPTGSAAPVASAGTEADGVELPFAFDGPPPPVAPEVITRDAAGRATIRAVRLTSPIRLDGRLDEEIYTLVPPISDFIQTEPRAGEPATQRTDVWVLFDRTNVYVTVRLWESNPERMIVNEMRRDNVALYRNDHIDVVFDTFYDRRNGVLLSTTPIGGLVDAQITNERQFHTDWNPVWTVETGRFEGGWTAEFAVPFKSLRYRPGRAQIWGFNVQRENLWKNEVSTLVPTPAALGSRGVMQFSLAPTLVGLEAPPGSKNLDIKPYAVSNLTTDRIATPKLSNDLGGDVGLDVKYGITQNLTTDFTYNTDFAQVEADEQQVNLTRFSLFFPEKREFFLENQGTFAFGGAATSGAASDTPILFYSRRIGLDGNRIVPIDAGGRLTGRIGRFTAGLLNIQADDVPAFGVRSTNFSVLRLKRDILRRSSIGALYTDRSVDPLGAGRNVAVGVDGAFAFFNNLSFNTYWARTCSACTGAWHTVAPTPGSLDDLAASDTSHRAQMDYAGDRYGLQLERLEVGGRFRPEMGFVRRTNMRKHFGLARFSPRPRNSKLVRKLFWTASMSYIEAGRTATSPVGGVGTRLETRDTEGEFAIEFHNSDRFSIGYGDVYEFLPVPFRIATEVVLPVGGYNYAAVKAGYNMGQQRRASANLSLEHGTFYDGHKTTVGISRGRFNLNPQLSIEPTVSINRVRLIEGSFTTSLAGSRVTYTMTPRMFVSALLQYNSGTSSLAANVRLRWEYHPGSELFVVLNEQRDTLTPRFPSLANRALIVKINRLLRF
jgi:hypothetical protein